MLNNKNIACIIHFWRLEGPGFLQPYPGSFFLTFPSHNRSATSQKRPVEMSFDLGNSPKMTREFDFDYDLLDKLLQGLQREGGDVEDIVTPIPGTEERNNRLGSEWIKQLENDLVQLIDEDTLSQSQSISTSPSPVGEDFFDQEWNEISNFLTINSLSTSPVHSEYFNHESITTGQSSNEALSLNRELQGHLKNILERTNFLEQQQRDLERVTDLLSSQVDKKFKKKHMDLPFWPHQIPTLALMDKVVQEARAIETTPPLQTDPRLSALDVKIKDYNKNLRVVPRWTFKERSSLAHGIRAQNEKILLGIIQAKGTHSIEECRTIIASFSEIDLLMNVNGIDWESISTYFVQTRSATDCRLQWTINDHPMINRSSLFDENEKEIEALKKIVPKVLKQVNSKGLPEGFCNPWQLIASQLGTNRTAIQCFMMYQRKLNPNFLKGKWTADEDEQLMTALKIYGTQNWQAVAQMIDGRTGQQCLHRYEKAINPEIKRGRWSTEEDELLKKAVSPFIESGASKINWSTVKLTVPGRTDVQCRERWVNILDPSISAAPFTPAEDQKLLEMVEIHGNGNWSKISQEFGRARTDNQLWRRWKQISKKKRGKPSSAAKTSAKKPIKKRK